MTKDIDSPAYRFEDGTPAINRPAWEAMGAPSDWIAQDCPVCEGRGSFCAVCDEWGYLLLPPIPAPVEGETPEQADARRASNSDTPRAEQPFEGESPEASQARQWRNHLRGVSA